MTITLHDIAVINDTKIAVVTPENASSPILSVHLSEPDSDDYIHLSVPQFDAMVALVGEKIAELDAEHERAMARRAKTPA